MRAFHLKELRIHSVFRDPAGTGQGSACSPRFPFSTRAEKAIEAKLGKGLECQTRGLWLYAQAAEPTQRTGDKSELGLERWLDSQSR